MAIKYKVPRTPKGTYYLTPELEVEFRRLYPVTFNRDLIEIFGMPESSLRRLARVLGIGKDMQEIKRKHAIVIKRTCENNGYYDSLRGKPVSKECREGWKRKLATGYNQLKHIQETDPKRYEEILEHRRETRRRIEEAERRRNRLGLPRVTNLHRPVYKYTEAQQKRRINALKRGYILGDFREKFCERYTIFYDEDTERSEKFESNSIAAGFTILPLTA